MWMVRLETLFRALLDAPDRGISLVDTMNNDKIFNKLTLGIGDVAAEKAFFRDQKKTFLKEVCGELMQGRKRANYEGKWSRHGAKRSDTTGQCLYDVERAYTM